MRIVKKDCEYCPPPRPKRPEPGVPRDWEMHPSWIAGIEALNAYGDWVSRYVLPIAFQWIEEHKPEVYASVPDEYRDDVGVVIAAAYKLVKELPAYQNGLRKCCDIDEQVASGAHDHSKTNPIWTGIVKKVRASTEEAFAEQAALLDDEQV